MAKACQYICVTHLKIQLWYRSNKQISNTRPETQPIVSLYVILAGLSPFLQIFRKTSKLLYIVKIYIIQ